jgi:hypothetical protein
MLPLAGTQLLCCPLFNPIVWPQHTISSQSPRAMMWPTQMRMRTLLRWSMHWFSLTLLSQTNPPHLSNDKDDNPNRSPGETTPCAIRAALCNHGTAMDAVIAPESHTPDKLVASYFCTMMATLDQQLSKMQQQQMTSANQWMASTKQWLNQRLSDIQWQMVTTIADSICNALKQNITPLCDNILTLGNHFNATTANATTFASTICHKIADTVTPLRAISARSMITSIQRNYSCLHNPH